MDKLTSANKHGQHEKSVEEAHHHGHGCLQFVILRVETNNGEDSDDENVRDKTNDGIDAQHCFHGRDQHEEDDARRGDGAEQ